MTKMTVLLICRIKVAKQKYQAGMIVTGNTHTHCSAVIL